MKTIKPNRKRSDAKNLPRRIRAYMKQHFENVPLSGFKKVRRDGYAFYEIAFNRQHSRYRIMFNAEGYLAQKVMEPRFDTIYDETGVGD